MNSTNNATFAHRTALLVFFTFSKNVAKLFQWASVEFSFLPQIGGQESVCIADCDESRFQRVL